MKIDLQSITVRDITDGYQDDGENGVVGYGGKLDIRPKFQREFVYKGKQRDAVIDTALRGFPLNAMYWAVKNGGGYELLDGQQRTVSICQFVTGDFRAIHEGKPQFFHNLPQEVRERFLNYKLQVYFCGGDEGEKLNWFRIINIAGEKLTEQELRNAVYCGGAWLPDAKHYFSRTGCPAYNIANKYVNGAPIRQDYLETAIKWICGGRTDLAICDYMNEHRTDADAKALWTHFDKVVDWIGATFPKTRKEMKGVDWGALYDAHSQKTLDSDALEVRVKALMAADTVGMAKSGIYPFVLDGRKKHLNLRAFPAHIKTAAYTKQDGKCAICEEEVLEDEAQADHIIAWSKGGDTVSINCQILCDECNRQKSDK